MNVPGDTKAFRILSRSLNRSKIGPMSLHPHTDGPIGPSLGAAIASTYAESTYSMDYTRIYWKTGCWMCRLSFILGLGIKWLPRCDGQCKTTSNFKSRCRW